MPRLALLACLLCVPLLIVQGEHCATSEAAEVSEGDWVAYDRDYLGSRYSPLNEIKTENLARLQPLCTYDSGEKTSFETGPVVVDGTLYFTTLDTTFAINADNCKLRWKHNEPLTKAERAGLGVNRGVAFTDGKVFRGYDDGNVVAIEAGTGKIAWSTPIAKRQNGETLPAAPLGWNGMVFIGNAGGDNFGVTGRIYALDANTGKIMWRFDVVPSSGPAAATWTKKAAQNPPTGGATWTSYHVDTATGILWSEPEMWRLILFSKCIPVTTCIRAAFWRSTPKAANCSRIFSR